ncbi:MAG TPA: EAL domain-containing protein [Xanthobacteraceae bacterium]|nr:EAL domain-containing protein [Xanthobacteraceae bacterium]
MAIVAGVLLLGLPSAVFNYRLNGAVERQSQEEMGLAARRTIALAESRIGRAISILDDLAARGVNSCDQAHLDALRQATFATTPVKELSVVAPDGSTLCSDLGGVLEQREVISSEPIARASNVRLEVVKLGNRPGHIVRITRPGTDTENGVAALIPTELLIPQVSTQGGPVGMNSHVATRAGTIIGEYIVMAEGSPNAANTLAVTLPSERYAIDAELSLPRSSLAARQAELRGFGALVTGGLAVLIFVFALMMPKRDHENPVTAIERAIKAGEIIPYYQPIVDIRTGQLRGAEVLSRWRKPDGTIVLPGTFIPLAEQSGLIFDLTRALMRQVGKELGPALLHRPDVKIGFNLVARHFANEEIVQDVAEVFKNTNIRLSQLVLEMTEREPIENLSETRSVIAALQGLGVRIAIDDVGTGHGGLSYMLKLGVDIIKIDKMFVDAIGVDRNATTIVETLIDLAQSMRMEIVAEGVESFEQVLHLRNLGVRGAQGFVFAPPLPGSSFLELLEAIDPLSKPAADEHIGAPSSARLDSVQAA